MRSISDNECLLLAGMMKFPHLIKDILLTSLHFSSDFPYEIYAILHVSNENIHKDHLTLSLIYELKKTLRITADENDFVVDGFGVPNSIVTESSVFFAYKKICDKRNAEILMSSLNNIHDYHEYDDKLQFLSSTLNSHIGKQITNVEITNIDDVPDEEESSPAAVTGIKSLDRKCHIHSNYLVIIAARPFTGKTTFACKLAMENTRLGKVLFISMEMNASSIKKKVDKYGSYYNRKNFFILERSEITISEISNIMVSECFDMVFIDQLNKIKSEGKNDTEKFSHSVRELKKLATRLKKPIFCLAQINRSAEESTRPSSHQIKSAGSIEEECDVALILHIPDEKRQEYITNVYLEKNRSLYGACGFFPLKFNPENCFYSE